MIRMNKLLVRSGLMALCLAVAPVAAYAAVAGHVQFVSGNVQVMSVTGQVRQAQKGGPINEGDMVSSAQQSSLQIKMQDGGFIAVRPNTKLKIEQFRFSGQADSGNDRSFFALIKGGFRSITGLIGQVNKQNYRVTTPAATIGIRGTDYEAVYTEAAPVNLAAADMLMAVTDVPAPIVGGGFAAAIVNKGAIEMGTDKGKILLQPGQGMVVSYGMNQLPVIKPLDVNLFPGAGKDKPSGQGSGKSENGEKKQGDAKDGGDAKGEEPSGENGKSGESDKAADNGQETAGDNSTADGGTTGDATTEPVRETSVVDAAPPTTGGVPAAVTPTVDSGMTTTLPDVPIVQPITLAVNGQTVNLVTQTIAPTGGGVVVPITGTSPLYPAPNGFGYEVLGTDSVGTWFNPFAINLPATSYLLDTTNNLMEVLGRVKFSGGVAKDTYKSADGSVYMGRWQGGTVTDQFAGVLNMGANSSQWVFAANPAAGYVQTLAGPTNYSLTAATHPTDALGNVGTLTSASLTADFTTQVVHISLALSFSTADPVNISTQNKAFVVVTTPGGIPISGQEIWGIGGVACTGANCDSAAGYTANIWARFAGNAADKVAIPYDITGNISDQVQGVALVSAPTPPVVSPVAPAGAVAPYTQTDKAFAFVTSSSNYLVPFAEIGTITAKPADMNNALPNPSFIDRNAGKDAASYIRYSLSGTTTVTAATTTMAPTGISFGRYDSTQATKQVVGTTTAGAAGTTTTPNAVYMHWITGPAISPIYLPEVLLGTSSYTFDGGTIPTDAFGAGATLDSATLSVNFTQQLVSFNLALTVGGAPWTASTAGAGTPLTWLNGGNAKAGFMATNVARPGWGGLTVTGATQGEIVGQLTGNGLNGALLSYYLVGGSSKVSGVAAFSGAAQNTATPYRLVAISTIDTIPAGQPNAGLVVPVTMGSYNNVSNVTFNGAGNVVQFVTEKPFSNGGSSIAIGSGTAALAGLGTDPVSGISWGRWVGGSLVVTDRVTNTQAALANNSSAHWIASPVLSGPVTLPVTGVFNYVRAGGTAPTDYVVGTQAVGVGTLNTATLSANFAAQTVNIGLNVTTPNAGNLIASAVNIPIQQGSMFNAATAGAINGNNIGSLTLTCGAGCTGTPQGEIGGAFAGPGGIGAAMLYGFSAGATNNILVNGAVAFHR